MLSYVHFWLSVLGGWSCISHRKQVHMRLNLNHNHYCWSAKVLLCFANNYVIHQNIPRQKDILLFTLFLFQNHFFVSFPFSSLMSDPHLSSCLEELNSVVPFFFLFIKNLSLFSKRMCVCDAMISQHQKGAWTCHSEKAFT